MKIGQYCQRQRCKHVELEQFWQAFASRGFVSDSWAFLYKVAATQKHFSPAFVCCYIFYSFMLYALPAWAVSSKKGSDFCPTVYISSLSPITLSDLECHLSYFGSFLYKYLGKCCFVNGKLNNKYSSRRIISLTINNF